MKTISTILSKLNPSFKGWVCIIVTLFFSPFICVFINYAFKIDLGPLFTFGISDRKDFFTVWIALFGAIGIAFNIYQNQKRTKSQEEQLEKQQTQIDLQSKSQRDSRFSKGIELLGNDNESARIGAAYSLCFLAKDYPEEFSKPVFTILCSHIRTLTTSEEYLEKHFIVSNEVQTILNLLFRSKYDKSNLFSHYIANLRYAHLEKIKLEGMDLKAICLEGSILIKADLKKTDLSEVHLINVNLEGADLRKANLRDSTLFKTNMDKSNLSSADLRGASIMEADLKDAKLNSADLRESSFERSDLRGAKLNNADLRESSFEGSDLRGADLSNADLREMQNGTLGETILIKNGMIATQQEGGCLKGADLDKIIVDGAYIDCRMKKFLKKNHVDVSKVVWDDKTNNSISSSFNNNV